MKKEFGIELFCRDCYHSWGADDESSVAECRINPPIQIDKDGLAVFPSVHLDDYWCSRGKAFKWQREY